MRFEFEFEKVSPEGDLREKIIDKLASIAKYLGNVAEDFRVGFLRIKKRPRWGYRVSLRIRLPGNKEVFAEARAKELLDAVDQVKDQIERQLVKFFEKLKAF